MLLVVSQWRFQSAPSICTRPEAAKCTARRKYRNSIVQQQFQLKPCVERCIASLFCITSLQIQHCRNYRRRRRRLPPLCPAGSEMPSHSLINRILSLLVLLACAGATCAASRGGGLQAKYLDTTRQLLSSQLAASPPPYYSGGASLVRRSLQAPAYYPPTLQRRALAGLSDIDEQR